MSDGMDQRVSSVNISSLAIAEERSTKLAAAEHC